MVKIQIDISNKLSRYLGIQREIYSLKDKRKVIIQILEDKLHNDKELMRRLEKQSIEV